VLSFENTLVGSPTAMIVPLSSGAVFAAPVMAGVTYMALRVPRLVCMELVERLLPTCRQRAAISVTRIVAVVHVAVKIAMSVKPGACADERPATEPIRPIISVGSTAIRSVVIVAIGACRLNSDIDTNLGPCFETTSHQADSRNSGERSTFESLHDRSLLPSGRYLTSSTVPTRIALI
jgi:hypothetical protein